MPDAPAPALSVSVSVSDLADSLTPANAAGVEVGAVNSKQVWYEFLTQNDDRVRPSHRALNGTTWRAGDPNAPVPPLDYGCRCYVRYVGAPGTPAADVLPPATGTPDTQGAAYATFLDKDPTLKALGIDWHKVQAAGAAVPVQDRDRTIVAALEAAGMGRGQAREYSTLMRMQEAAPASTTIVLTPEAQATKLADKAAKAALESDATKAAKAEASGKWDALVQKLAPIAPAAADVAQSTAQAVVALLGAYTPDMPTGHMANMANVATALADQAAQHVAASNAALAAGDKAKAAGNVEAMKAAAIDLTTAAGRASALREQAITLGKDAVAVYQADTAKAAVAASKAKAAAEAAAVASAAATAANKAAKDKGDAILSAAAKGDQVPMGKPPSLPDDLQAFKQLAGTVTPKAEIYSPAQLAALVPTVATVSGVDVASGIKGTVGKTTPIKIVEMGGKGYVVQGNTTLAVALAKGADHPVEVYKAADVSAAVGTAKGAMLAADQAAKLAKMEQADLAFQASQAVSVASGHPALPPVGPVLTPKQLDKAPIAPIPGAPPPPTDPGAAASYAAAWRQRVAPMAKLEGLRDPGSKALSVPLKGPELTGEKLKAMARDAATPRSTFADTYRSDVANRIDKESVHMEGLVSAGEKKGINAFTYQWDHAIRAIDMGAKTDAQMLEDIRNGQRLGKGPGGAAESILATARKHHANIHSVMARIPARRFEYVYRGHSGMSADSVASILGSQSFSFGAVTSTSGNVRTGRGFASTGSGHAMLFRIKNAAGIPIKAMSHYTTEDEVFITGRDRYKVTGWAMDSTSTPDAPRWLVDMEAIE